MFSWSIYFAGLGWVLLAAAFTWLFSLKLRDVSIVDSLWSLLFLLLAWHFAVASGHWGSRTQLMLGLVTIWALRLSIYITWRHRGQPEDHRYRAIRERNQPNFPLKSLYLVFALQAVLAWVISLPLFGAALGERRAWAGRPVGCRVVGIGFFLRGGRRLAAGAFQS